MMDRESEGNFNNKTKMVLWIKMETFFQLYINMFYTTYIICFYDDEFGGGILHRGK